MMVLGLSEGVAQVVLLREVITYAGGNELSFSVALAVWLLWTALGSLTAARLVKNRPFVSLTPVLLFSGFSGLAALGCALLLPGMMGFSPGFSPGLASALAYCLICLAPAGLMGGAHYPLLLSSLEKLKRDPSGLARLYGLESLGGALAGLLFGLLLVWIMEPWSIMVAVAALCGVTALLTPGRGRIPALLCLAALLPLAIWADSGGAWLKERQWQGRGLEAWSDSPYAQLILTSRAEQKNFFASGAWLFSQPDQLTLERRALAPLLAAPRMPEQILFIGGGASGEAAQAIKWSGSAKVVAVELDPWLVELAGRSSEVIKGLELVYGDGRVYMSQTSKRFDLAVASLPPPSTIQLNRYYSREGLAAMGRILKPGGAAVLRLPGVPHLLGPLEARRIRSILDAARPVFPGLVLYSGEELFICLYKNPVQASDQAQIWLARFNRYGWQDAVGVRPDTIFSALDPRRTAFLLDQTSQAPPGPANGDYLPRALLFDPDIWGVKLGGLSAPAHWLAEMNPHWFFWKLVQALVLLLLAALLVQRRIRSSVPALLSGVAVSGFSCMAGSLLLLVIYQVVLGAVYLGLALVLAAFMAGLGLAALAGQKGRPKLFWLAALHLALALLGLGLGLIAHMLPTGSAPWPLYGLSCGLGIAGGVYFAWAGRLALKSQSGTIAGGLAGQGGRLYGLDLLGGMLGALLPAVLLPTVGLDGALGLFLLVNLTAAFWLAIAGHETSR